MGERRPECCRVKHQRSVRVAKRVAVGFSGVVCNPDGDEQETASRVTRQQRAQRSVCVESPPKATSGSVRTRAGTPKLRGHAFEV